MDQILQEILNANLFSDFMATLCVICKQQKWQVQNGLVDVIYVDSNGNIHKMLPFKQQVLPYDKSGTTTIYCH